MGFGYSCVPYYQCSNGSIITDGAGLIDIRNGFGALNPEESKCRGFLDVCCKDPDFVAPPPKPRYASKCGSRLLLWLLRGVLRLLAGGQAGQPPGAASQNQECDRGAVPRLPHGLPEHLRRLQP